jgi:hypothetical protein
MLREFPDRLEYCFTMIPVQHKYWAPGSWAGVPSEALTAIEQICHVRDIEIDGYQHRLERTLLESVDVSFEGEDERARPERRKCNAIGRIEIEFDA